MSELNFHLFFETDKKLTDEEHKEFLWLMADVLVSLKEGIHLGCIDTLTEKQVRAIEDATGYLFRCSVCERAYHFNLLKCVDWKLYCKDCGGKLLSLEEDNNG